MGFADLAGDALLELHGLFVTGGFDLLRELAFHFGGARAFLLRVAKDAEPLKAGAADEVEEVLEFLLGLAGEADDEGGSDRDAGDAGTDAGEEGLDVLGAGLAAHELEHAGMDVLEGDVDVAADVAGGGDGGDEFVAPMRGVGVEEAEPEFAVDLIQLLDQTRERGAFR